MNTGKERRIDDVIGIGLRDHAFIPLNGVGLFCGNER